MTKKRIRWIITIVLIIGSIGYQFLVKKTYSLKKEVTLNSCVDGDTAIFNYNNRKIKARFLAIDTPETIKKDTPVQPYGKKASKFTCDKLTNAKKIRLEYEDKKTDRYKRHLVWVFVDNQLLQEELVREGLAKVTYLYDDYRYTNILLKAQKKAEKEKLNIWSVKK